jgi:hypothetical protein
LVPKLRFQKKPPFMKDFLGFLDDNLHNSVVRLFIRHELLFFKNTVVDSYFIDLLQISKQFAS